MSNKSKKTEIEAFGLETDKLLKMNGSLSPFLMLTSRLSAALVRHPELRDSLDDQDPELIAVLSEYFYALMIIWDRHRPDMELDDSQMNEVRLILEKK